MPSSASDSDHAQHLADQLGVERRGDLVAQQHAPAPSPARARSPRAAAGRRRADRARRRTSRPARRARAACAPARSRRRASRFLTSVGASITLRPTLRCGNRLKLWKIMPTCWRSARIAARVAVPQRLAVDRERAFLEGLQAVDAAQQRALARAALADDGDHLAAARRRGRCPSAPRWCRSACAGRGSSTMRDCGRWAVFSSAATAHASSRAAGSRPRSASTARSTSAPRRRRP